MSDIQVVKEATAIEDVIGQRVSLTRSGNYLRGLCPFHSEKSPSFFVSPQMQRFKCFGCAAAGDVFEFLQRYEGLTFYEVLQTLAETAGIELQKTSASPADQQRERVREILNLAKEYYHFLLTKHEVGKPAREYLQERGITQESIKIFQLGYAMSSWDGLIKFLHDKKKYQISELVAAGLVVENQQKRQYDRFRERIIFPLNDYRGRVVGFSGRVLDPTIKTAKYINSPETELYHKSQLLYGLSELYQEIRKKESVIVVEGEFDVISSAQAHVNNIVAIKGSALTAEHARIISRTVSKVILALDADSAGIEATKRAIPICTQAGLELRVISVSEGKDPDDLARKHPDEWRKAAEQSLSVYAYLLKVALSQHDAATPEGQRHIIDELAPVFNHITHAVEKEFYIKELAKALGVKESLVRSDITQFGVAKKSLGAVAKKDGAAKPRSRREHLERYLWHVWLASTAGQRMQFWTELQPLEMTTPELQQLRTQLEKNPSFGNDSWSQSLPSDMQQYVFDLLFDPTLTAGIDPTTDTADEWRKTLMALKKATAQDRIVAITAELDTLDEQEERTPDQDARQQALLEEIVRLRQKS